MNVLALIMADSRNSHLGILAQDRSVAAVPFGGKYRAIDFALSNCANSGLLNIGVLTQYQPHSLNDHIRTGRPWDLERKLAGGVTLLPPYLRSGSFLDWYRGTADAVYQNLDFILRHKPDTILVLSADHVYKMDYSPLIRYHQQRQADVTLCVTAAPPGKPLPPDTLATDDDGRVIAFHEQALDSPKVLASMGVCAFRADRLIQRLTQNARLFDSVYSLNQDVLPRMLELGDQIYVYHFEGYAASVDTVQAYWEANMNLLSPAPPLDILDRRWNINTRSKDCPPVNIGPGSAVSNSLITDGCIIEGRVEHSVLSPGVRVRAGAVIWDSIIFHDCEIGPGAIVERAILDKNVVVGENVHIGIDLDRAPHRRSPDSPHSGVTLIGRNTRLPAGLRVGRDCVVCNDLTTDDLADNLIVDNQRVGFQPANIALEPQFVAQEPRNGRQHIKESH